MAKIHEQVSKYLTTSDNICYNVYLDDICMKAQISLPYDMIIKHAPI